MNNAEPSPKFPMAGLARLWPNREHESNWLKALLCSLGLHRWHKVTQCCDGQNEIEFCRWCPKIMVDGAIIK